jgi:hypothetical protein
MLAARRLSKPKLTARPRNKAGRQEKGAAYVVSFCLYPSVPPKTLRVGRTLAMLFPDLHRNRSEYFTGPAILACPTLPTISVQTCLDCVQDESSTTRIHDPSAETAHIVGWVLVEDAPVLISYADAIRQGCQTVLLLSNGTPLTVTSLDPNGTIQCDPTID